MASSERKSGQAAAAVAGFVSRVARRAAESVPAWWFVLVVAVASQAPAQIVAPAGRTLFNEGLLARALVRFDAYEGRGKAADRRQLTSSLALVWGARPHLSVSLVVPWARSTSRGVSTTGSADASLFARYDVVRRTVPGGYTRVAPELGIKLPTGGAFGSGSTDVLGALVVSHVRDPDWWVADVQATLRGSGDAARRRGDRVRFDVAYLRRLLPRRGLGVPMLLAVVELNGESEEVSRRGGVPIANTGGERLFLSPGVEYIVGRLVLEASVPIPIYERLRGAQPEPRTSVVLGMRWLF